MGRGSGSSRSSATSTPRSPSWPPSSFRPLDAQRCAELLYGTHGFWVADYLDQADPPPSYGLFPHVRLDVLAERAGARLPIHA